MKRMIMIVCALVLAFTSTVEAKTYKIAVVPWIGFSPADVAEAKGFWKKLGLDVKVYSLQSTQAVQNALEKKRVDIAFNMIGTGVGWYQEGMPAVLLAETSWSHGGDKIIAKKGIDAKNLKGKPIGVYADLPAITFFLGKYLDTIGLKLSDTRIIEMETAPLADKFIKGLFSVIVSYDPDALRAEREGNGKVVATSAMYEGAVPEGMISRKDIAESIPSDDLVKIMKGWIEAVTWIHDSANWNEYVKILNDRTFKGDSYSEKDIKEMAGAVKIHDGTVLAERNRPGGGAVTYLKDLKSFLSANKLLKKDYKPEEFFMNKAVLTSLE